MTNLRLTKEEVYQDLGHILDGLQDGHDADGYLSGPDKDVVFVSLEWSADLTPEDSPVKIPGWIIWATDETKGKGASSEFVGSLEADWHRDEKIEHIYESIAVQFPDLMPLPTAPAVPVPAPVPGATVVGEVVVIKNRSRRDIIAIHPSLEDARLILNFLPDQIAQSFDAWLQSEDKDRYHSPDGSYHAEVWKVRK